MLDRTLSAASHAAGVHEVLVESPAPRSSNACARLVHRAWQHHRGLNPPLREAEALLAPHRLTTIVVLPIDLPLLQVEEVERLGELVATRARGPGSSSTYVEFESPLTLDLDEPVDLSLVNRIPRITLVS